jgi:hypothetical protein
MERAMGRGLSPLQRAILDTLEGSNVITTIEIADALLARKVSFYRFDGRGGRTATIRRALYGLWKRGLVCSAATDDWRGPLDKGLPTGARILVGLGGQRSEETAQYAGMLFRSRRAPLSASGRTGRGLVILALVPSGVAPLISAPSISLRNKDSCAHLDRIQHGDSMLRRKPNEWLLLDFFKVSRARARF